MRRHSTVFLVALFVAVLLGARMGDATPALGGGIYLAKCKEKLGTWPVTTPTPAATPCTGAAVGAVAGAAGKSGAYLSVGNLADMTTKPGGNGTFDNFQLYNVTYSEICGGSEPLPLIGLANGELAINGDEPITGADSFVHARFGAARVGAVYVAIIDGGHAHNGHAGQGTAHSFGGGTVNGVSAGVVALDAPVGSCSTPNPSQSVTIVGVFALGI